MRYCLLLLMYLVESSIAGPSPNSEGFWSKIEESCTANSFLKRNATNDGWQCSNESGVQIVVGDATYSSSGINTTGPVTFSSNVVITVNSTKQKAIFLPSGGIHLDDGVPSSGATAPGQMFAKKILTSTITIVGSAILFQDKLGVVKATMTSTSLEIDGVIVKSPDGLSCAKIGMSNSRALALKPLACP